MKISCAPCASIRFFRSALALSGMTICTGTPMMRPIIEYAIPALPEELSRTTLPGLSRPSSTAPRSIRSTGRSFRDPPGFSDSILEKTSTSGSSRRKMSTGTSGVLPTARSAG